MRTNRSERARSKRRNTSPAREVRGPGGNLTCVSSGVYGFCVCSDNDTRRRMRILSGCRFPAFQRCTCRELPCLLTHHRGSSTQGWRDPDRNKNAKSWRADQSVQIWNGCNSSPIWKQSQLGFSQYSPGFATGNTARKTFIHLMCLAAQPTRRACIIRAQWCPRYAARDALFWEKSTGALLRGRSCGPPAATPWESQSQRILH